MVNTIGPMDTPFSVLRLIRHGEFSTHWRNNRTLAGVA